MKTYVIGDIHGELFKLMDAITNTPLKEGDRLIFLGDYVDRGPNSFGVVDYIIKLQDKYDCKFIKGNHDHCFFEGALSGKYSLMDQGCKETIESYIEKHATDKEIYLVNKGVRDYGLWKTNFNYFDFPIVHYKFFKELLPYYIDENNNLFVHGGFNRHYHIKDDVHNSEDVLMWDRDLLAQARSYSSMKNDKYPFKMKDNFNHVFVGHTPCQYFDSQKPLTFANVTCVDTGAGKFLFGTVTIMDIETKQFVQK